MAVIKSNYIKRGAREKATAKATIRYIEHRKGKDGKHMSRMLFGRDGAMGRYNTYKMIDQAGPGCIFYRIILSPDPKDERESMSFYQEREEKGHTFFCMLLSLLLEVYLS